MTYTADIPLSGETLGSTRDRVRANFQQVASLIAQNHIGFNTSGQGKHKFLQMPEQSLAPTTLVNEAGFYSKVATNPAETNLFFRGENDGFEYQLTRADQANTGRFANNSTYQADHQGGWTFLPGGMILQYGLRTNITANTTSTVTFPIPFVSGCYSVSLSRITTGNPSNEMVINANATNSNFVINNNSNTGNSAYWYAIGV